MESSWGFGTFGCEMSYVGLISVVSGRCFTISRDLQLTYEVST